MSGRARFAMGEVLGFLGELWSVNHAIERASKRMEATIGLTAQQRVLIRIVGKHPGISPGQLADLLALDAGTVSTAVRRLEARQLVRRRRDPRDGRRVEIGLTAKGRMLDVPMAGTVESAIGATLAASTDAETRVMRRMLRRLAKHLLRPEATAGEVAGARR